MSPTVADVDTALLARRMRTQYRLPVAGGRRAPSGRRANLRIVSAETRDTRDFPYSELRGGYVVTPGAVRATIADDELGLLVSVDAVVRGGQLVAQRVEIRKVGEPDEPTYLVTDKAGPGVTGSDLRNLRVSLYLDALLDDPQVFSVAQGTLMGGAQVRSGPFPNPRAIEAQRGRRDGDQRAAQVIAEYQRLLSDPQQRHRAATATAENLHLSRSYVMRILKRHREEGQ
jgi:hypothetical protein